MRYINDYNEKINDKESIRIIFQEHCYKTGISGQVYQIHEIGMGETYLFTIFKEIYTVIVTPDLVEQIREEIITESKERLKGMGLK